VLRFDFTGPGSSEGEFADTNVTSNVEDLLAAARFLESRDLPPAILIGHSFGGWAVLNAAPAVESCRAVVTIGAPSRAEHEGHPLGLRRLRVALLVMHAPLDAVVPVENATEIFTHAIHPKSFVTLDDADHLLTRSEDARYAAEVIAAWSSRYLEKPVESPPDDDWVLTTTGQNGFATSVTAAGHSLIADEPISAGGTELGPSPYDYLSAALASCTSMTMQMYARRKGWEIGGLTAAVRHSKIHAEDCERSETRAGRIDRFDRRLIFPEQLPRTMRERLAKIADRCPVHRTLVSEVDIVTTSQTE
jgi:uncharacterized OsmC-like protein/alpha/beta superfamily hydrolase